MSITAKFTAFDNCDVWVKGTAGPFLFEAALFDEPSRFGIDEGRVSKLSIWDEKIRAVNTNFFSACIVNYDRGWDIEAPASAVPYYNAVMQLLTNAPKRF